MLEVLNWIYGEGAQNDPYYLLLRDFVLLMPWWYPWFWVSIIAAFFSVKYLRRWQRRRRSLHGLKRVKSRTDRILNKQIAQLAARRRRRQAANDVMAADRPSVA